MTGPSKTQNKNKPNHRFIPKPKPSTPQEAVPIFTFGPSNNWIDFSKKMVIAAGDRFGRLGDFIKSAVYYPPTCSWYVHCGLHHAGWSVEGRLSGEGQDHQQVEYGKAYAICIDHVQTQCWIWGWIEKASVLNNFRRQKGPIGFMEGLGATTSSDYRVQECCCRPTTSWKRLHDVSSGWVRVHHQLQRAFRQ